MLFQSFQVLETERLFLRELRESDAGAVLQIFGDDAVTHYYDLPTFTDIAQARQLIARMNARNASGDALRWGIALRENDTVIGTGGFNQFARGWFGAGVGYDLAQAYWNKGYMTEALRAMTRFGFDALLLNRIEALVVPGNLASARVLEKVGFSREGILREYGYWQDRFWDLEMFALLKRDAWEARQDGIY